MTRHLMIVLAILFVFTSAYAAENDVSWNKVDRSWVGTETMTFDLNSGSLVNVSRFAGDVKIVGENRDDILLTITFSADRRLDQEDAQSKYDDLRPTIIAVNDELKIEGPERRFNWNSKHGWIELTLHTPKSLNIEAGVSGGDIVIETIEGEFDLSTSGGDADLKGTKGPLLVSSSGGDIEIIGHQGFQDLSASGGDVNLRETSGEINVSSSGGDVEFLQVSGKLKVSASGGDVLLEEINAKRLRVDSSGGSIDLLNVSIEERAMLSASGGDINTSNTNGSIELSTSGGDIDVDTHSGDILAEGSAGDVMLREINGSLDVDLNAGTLLASLSKSAGNDFTWDVAVSSGDAIISIPESAKVDLVARVHNGGGVESIRSDFPLTTKKRGHSVTANGEINGGGASIHITVGGGDIRIKKI
ncbi:MAG TPA: hypothetical protein ENH10_05165 [Bacteroidetes bacterium]|nr:hypothetical protein [Bacteroidota bacterium]HEX04532.1 hypothetical protein [Bacteroidota bacterium]